MVVPTLEAGSYSRSQVAAETTEPLVDLIPRSRELGTSGAVEIGPVGLAVPGRVEVEPFCEFKHKHANDCPSQRGFFDGPSARAAIAP